MTGKNQTKALRKENTDLRCEIEKLKDYVKRLEEEIRNEKRTSSHLESSILSTEGAKTVEFVSDQCDAMVNLHDKTLKALRDVSSQLDDISKRCSEITSFIDNAEDYSYQYNLKVIGMPLLSVGENAEATTHLCLRLFSLIGAKDVTLSDIDIAHRVPARKPSKDRPNAIVCRFTRRLAKNKVLACRKNVFNVTSEQLGLDPSVSVERLNIFEHLSPRQQDLFYEAKKFKKTYNYKYCWVKDGIVFLRETDESSKYKLKKEQDLLIMARNACPQAQYNTSLWPSAN